MAQLDKVVVSMLGERSPHHTGHAAKARATNLDGIMRALYYFAKVLQDVVHSFNFCVVASLKGADATAWPRIHAT